MDGWVQVIPSDDLPKGTPDDPGIRRVVAGRVTLLVARLESGEVVAFDTVCPHQLTNLEEAYFWEGGDARSEGALGPALRCPRHQYLYDLRTGENLLPTREAPPETLWKLKPGYLPTYKAEERDGWVWVDPTPNPPPASYDPERERRPAAGEATEAPAADSETGPLEHPTKTLRVREGSAFELRIPMAPRPGFAWNVKVTGSLKIMEEGYVPGDQPRHRVKLRAKLAGEGTVRCTFGRPWDKEPAEVRTYMVQIVASK